MFLIAVFAVLSFSSAVYAHHSQNESKALYGQKLLGIEVGGKTAEEVKSVLESKIASVRLNFNVGEEDYVATPQDAGITFKIEKTSNEIISGKAEGEFYEPWLKSGYSVINYFWPENPVTPKMDASVSYEIDKEKLGNFTQGLSQKFSVESKNAALVMNGTEIEVVPAVYGRKIMVDSIERQISQSMTGVNSLNIGVEVEKVDPGIVEEETRESIARAKELFNLPVVYTYQGKTFTPTKATVASWIVFRTDSATGTEKLIPVIDAKKVYPYIYGLSKEINIPAVNKKVTVRNGTEQVVEQEGKNGLALDADLAASRTATILTTGKPVSMVLPTYVVKFKTKVNNIVVANWEKYITVDISEQRMCAYLAGGVQVQCWAITTGATAKGYYTPIGTFLIQRKSGAGGVPGSYGGGVCMPNPPYAQPLCGINYVSTFTPQGHAIHEAWWRTSFGTQAYKWNGSHGCVNASYAIAKWIYYWAPIGTPVIISN